MIKKEKPRIRNYSKSDLKYNTNDSFYKYFCDILKKRNPFFKIKAFVSSQLFGWFRWI